MLDIQFIREHPDVVKESQRKRGESVELVDEVLKADDQRRSALQAYETSRAEQKSLGRQVASASGDSKAELIAGTKKLAEQVGRNKTAADEATAEYTNLL